MTRLRNHCVVRMAGVTGMLRIIPVIVTGDLLVLTAPQVNILKNQQKNLEIKYLQQQKLQKNQIFDISQILGHFLLF